MNKNYDGEYNVSVAETVNNCLIVTMHPATLHGVGVITKLYFAIIVAFNIIYEINDPESHSDVIQGHRFWYQSKARVHIPISGQ